MKLKLSKKAKLWTLVALSVLTVVIIVCSIAFCKKPDPTPDEPTTYTVTFNTNDGSAIAPVQLNYGDVIARPTDPEKSGNVFVGWYADSEYKTPFYFNASAKITKDLTLYARWEVDTVEKEFVIDFNSGVQGLNYNSMETINAKVFADKLPAAVRSGYTFAGWAVSMYDDAEKLSYMWQDGMVVAENMTFHALWTDSASQKLPTPAVTVAGNTITWGAISGVSTYHVTVSGPDGFEAVSRNTGSTTVNVNFANAPVGDYEITVQALASDTSKSSDVAYRSYINKALSRVSHFEVEGTTVKFNEVANATDYLLSIDCGDKNHNHTEMSLNGATEYDFASCVTTTGKVSFVVTSYADGYAAVESRAFSFKKTLDDVTGVNVDESTGIVSWTAVQNAEKYVVSVDCGNANHTHENVVVGGTQFDLKECAAKTGGIKVEVYAVANTFGNSQVAEYTYNKTTLATPGNVKIVDKTVSWDAVTGATGYTVKVGSDSFTTATNSIDLSAQQIAWVEANDYVINLQATGENGAASLWSNDVDARYYAMYDTVEYSEGYVYWNHVIGATSYTVQVNDGATVTVDGGVNYAPITFTKEGVNTISVCYTDGTNTSSAVTVEVTAYKVVFNTRVTGQTFATQYKAVGDPVDSFYEVTFKKSGYDFYGWYEGAEVGAGNADLYEDLYFRNDENLTLYADYTAKTYFITYNYGTDGNGSAMGVYVTFDQYFQLEVPTPYGESGFDAWYTAPEGTGTQLTDSNGVSLAPWTIAVDEVTGSDVIYAFWNDYVLDFKETQLAGSNAKVYQVSAGRRINAAGEEVTIPQTYKGRPVKAIAANGFDGCNRLKRVNIPNTVELIFTTGAKSFSNCSLLEEINVYEVAGNNAIRYYSEAGVLFDLGRLDEQDGSVELVAFPANYKQKAYTVPDGVTLIPAEVFTGVSLEEITISATVKSIETRAFYQASALTTVNFADPADLTKAIPLTIKDRAFEDCDALVTANFPARLKSFGTVKYGISGVTASSGPEYDNVSTSHSATTPISDVFYGCAKIAVVNVAEGGEYYSSEDGVVFNTNKTELLYAPKYYAPANGHYEIPQGVQRIAEGAFVYCYNLKSVYIPNTVTEIGECAFYQCYAIKTLEFQGNGFNDVAIGDYAFRNAYYIEEIIFPANQITTIGTGAFMTNYKVKEFTIPATVSYLGDQAFRGWYYLEKVNFTEPEFDGAELTFGNAVFYGSLIQTLSIPAHAIDLGDVFNGLNKLKAVEVHPDNEYYTTVGGILYDNEMKKMLYFPKDLTTVPTLPDTLEEIGAGVFLNNKNITSFVVPNTVKLIGANAFEGARLTSLTFATGNDTNELTIGGSAFKDCDYITSLVLPVRTKTIGTYAISSMDSLTSLTLNDGLTEIGKYAVYSNPALTSLAIPDSVTKIGYSGIASNYALASITFGAASKLEEIGAWGLANNKAMESIVIPATVKYLRYYSLHQGSGSTIGKLNQVTFATGSQLEIIEPYAFYYVQLKTITIPKTVTEIGSYAFEYSKLEEIVFEKGGTENLTLGAPSTYVSNSNGITTSTSYGYVFGYTNLKSFEIPARATEIGTYAFYGSTALKSLTFEEGTASSLQQIGNYAFRYCYELTEINLPKSLTNLGARLVSSTKYNRTAIGHYAFADCTKLSTVNFEMGGDRPMTFGIGVFNNCPELTTLNLPSRFVSYKNDLSGEEFGPLGERLTNKSATYTPSIFDGCTKLTAINVIMNQDGTPFLAENELTSHDGVAYVDEGKTLLRIPVGRVASYEVPNTVERIDEFAAVNAEKLTAITFEEGNDALELLIDQRAFENCTSLTSVVLAKRVKVLAPRAFLNCTNLTSFELSANLSEFDATVFEGCTALAAVNVATGSLKYSSKDGVLFNAINDVNTEVNTLYYYPASKTDKVYSVPSTVKTIYSYAFSNNANLEEVILPLGLQAIDSYAFYNATALKTVNIRKNVATIGDYAFYNCTALENLTFEEGGTSPLIIGDANYINLSVFNSETSTSNVKYGQTFYNCYMLTNVTLPERTKFIADYTFEKCLGLKTINIPNNVEKLGNGAFRSCERLENVTFDPDEVKFTVIPHSLFEYCYSLKSFVVPASVTEFAINKKYKNNSIAFAYCTSLESVVFQEGIEISSLPRGLFAFCESLTSISIPASVTEFVSGASTSYASGTGVFHGCTSLSEVIWADDAAIEFIGSYAFTDCHSLAEFTIPESVQELGSNVFRNCKSLDNVIIPDHIYIDECAGLFYGCESLKTYQIPEMFILPDYFLYNCKSITEFEISEDIGEVYYGVFYGTGIDTVELKAGVYYEYGAFSGMPKLKNVTIEEGVTELYDEMFAFCKGLETIYIPDSVEYIGYMAFYECSSLREVRLPENSNCTALWGETFWGCKSLEEIEVPANFKEINWGDFTETGLVSVTLPGVEILWDEAFRDCPNLKSVTLGTELVEMYSNVFDNCVSLEEFIFPEGSIIETIDASVFNNCTSLERVVLPQSIKTISNYAFRNCSSLVEINIPASCTNINFTAFIGCTSLTNLTLEEGNEAFVKEGGILYNAAKTQIMYVFPEVVGTYELPEDLTTIAAGAFTGSQISEFVLPANVTEIPDSFFAGIAADTVIIPEGVERIGKYAFAYSKIKSIVIPGSVSLVDEYAFQGCADLTSVTFTESNTRLYLGAGLFNACVGLTEITIPYRVRLADDLTKSTYAVGANAFKDCSNLASIVIEETPAENGVSGVINFGSYAFNECTSLTRIDFPAALGNATYRSGSSTYTCYAVNNNAFQGCTALETVTFNEVEGQAITLYGSSMFDGCVSLRNIVLPSTLTGLYFRMFAETAIEEITIPASVTTMSTSTEYIYDDNGMYVSSKTTGKYFYNCKNLRRVVIESKATSVGKGMFEGCTALESVVFNTDTITTIDNDAFVDCTSLAELVIPSTVTTFGTEIFSGWTSAQKLITNKTEAQTNCWSVLWKKNCQATIVYL